MSMYPTYSESVALVEQLAETYRSAKVETPIDCGTGNILITGRANSGVEELEATIIAHLEETDAPYVIFDLDAGDSLEEVISKTSLPGYTVVVRDIAGKLFAKKSFVQPQNLIYITRHWDKRANASDYTVFDHHLAFASLRNQDVSEYTGPYSSIGSELRRGEYVSVNTGQFSAIDLTLLTSKAAA